ncbi:protein-disulfide reductase DsbD [Pasteurellaceae bacterium LIM206]|nr:protein-disulfide reductase DsbD [Pasteurellaceae bacterium LIM206]
MKKLFIFLLFSCLAFAAQASLFGQNKPRFLIADEAFQFTSNKSDNRIDLHWQIADGYYLYKKEIQVATADGTALSLSFPPAEMHQDEFFGAVDIFRNNLNLSVNVDGLPVDAVLNVSYQGCTTGFCYPPETKTVALDGSAAGEKTANFNTALSDQSEAEHMTSASRLTEQDQLADKLFQSKYAVFWFFLLGLGLAFTPCVLPMLPLLSAIVIGGKERPSMGRAFLLSLIYVQGMALTYTLLGLIVAAIGLPFQVALQSPYVLIGLSLLFVLLSLSMFGVYNLQLPSALQTKLTLLSQKQKSGAFGGVFVMGMLAGLVASPCTSAPLSGALLYVAQSGDLFTGAVTLYLLALGMGLPLILITLFGNKILPKSGAWMDIVKELFGFILLLLPVMLLERVFPQWSYELWALWFIGFCCWIAAKRFWAGFIAALLIFFGAHHFFPMQAESQTAQSAVSKNAVFSHRTFTKVTNYAELRQALAQNPKAIAMLDLYADWCVACKEFEKYTFADQRVQQAFEDVLLLQVDMTKNSADNAELMKRFNVLGLPTILFFNQQGEEIPQSRITGFVDADAFLPLLQKYMETR